MTDLRKAAEMALDALKLHLLHHEHGCVYLNPVMYALEAALAQPEQEFKYTPYGLRSDENGKLSIGEISQREWVGLTLNEITGHICDCADDDGTYKISCFIDYAKAIEQKLKDLNT